MKKLLSLVLAIVLILSVTAVVAVNAADDFATVSLCDIYGNIVKTNTYKVGETFEVTVYLNTTELGTIGALKAEQTYTSSVLALADELKSSGSIKNLEEVFPVTTDKTTANGALDGKISYNASTPDMHPDAFKFDSDTAKLAVTHYTVTAAGTASIGNNIVTLALADFELTKIINKSVVNEDYKDNFSMRYTLSDPEPVVIPTQAPTTAPTLAPTQAPTTAPTLAPTQAPTQAPTLAPTQPPTQRPTVAPTQPPTQRPTVAPTQPPTQRPTVAPTQPPTQRPTIAPTQPPTQRPTVAPTLAPTQAPTQPPTVPVSYILGDVNSDNKIDMHDPTYIRRYCAGIRTGLSEESIRHGDVDRNGEVVIMDATYIQQYLAEMSVSYPIGTTVTG